MNSQKRRIKFEIIKPPHVRIADLFFFLRRRFPIFPEQPDIVMRLSHLVLFQVLPLSY